MAEMLLLRVGKSVTRLSLVGVRANSSTAAVAKAPEKIEVFVDDQSVFVEPGTTVLQVTNLVAHSNDPKWMDMRQNVTSTRAVISNGNALSIELGQSTVASDTKLCEYFFPGFSGCRSSRRRDSTVLLS